MIYFSNPPLKKKKKKKKQKKKKKKTHNNPPPQKKKKKKFSEKAWVISFPWWMWVSWGLAFSFACGQAFAFVFLGCSSWHFVLFAGKLVFLLLLFQNRDYENSIPTTLLECK
jgi:hypothetical protein